MLLATGDGGDVRETSLQFVDKGLKQNRKRARSRKVRTSGGNGTLRSEGDRELLVLMMLACRAVATTKRTRGQAQAIPAVRGPLKCLVCRESLFRSWPERAKNAFARPGVCLNFLAPRLERCAKREKELFLLPRSQPRAGAL